VARRIGGAVVDAATRRRTVLATARSLHTGGNSETIRQADVSTRAAAAHVIKTTLERLGGLDILINNSVLIRPGGGALALSDEI